tara:strand:+ start:3017 stop:4219 length:1203 start_codon:yes stop_codon:yes gene_type:complete
MNYQDTLNYLFSQLPMYQRTGCAAYKKDIGNIVEACEILGNPQKKFKSIHIAGTNGKGSTAHIISSILEESGMKTGLYTSPHLKDFRERIRINGEMIKKDEVVQFVCNNKNEFQKINMSFFEYTVAMAFHQFAKHKVEIAVIETGLGGRLDSTNIIEPEISIITNIGFDHMNLLGNSLKEIAYEKAGIIKNKTPIIIGKKQKEIKNIIENIACNKDAPIYYAQNHQYYLQNDLPNYQKENINTSITAIKKLNYNITAAHIKNGLKNITKNGQIKGRWQRISEKPIIICDTAHNEEGILNVIEEIKKISFRKLHFVFGTVNDKNINKILCLLPNDALYYFCHANINRALDSEKLKEEANKFNLKGNSYSNTKKAYLNAIHNAKENDLILITGSTFIVGEIL